MFQTDLDLAAMASFLIQLSMMVIGVAFVVGFSVKKMFHMLKSF